MDKRSCVIAAFAAVSLILVATFYKVERNEFDCDVFDSGCVHFCSTDEKESPDDLVNLLKGDGEFFDMVLEDEDSKVKVLRGNLKCLETKILTQQQINESSLDDKFEMYVSLHHPEANCLEFMKPIDGNSVNKSRPWVLHTCDKNVTMQRIFHGIGESLKFIKISLI